MALPLQVHVDLETMDTRDTARILAIGAVCDEHEFYVEIDQDHYRDTPFTESESTKKWWTEHGGFQPSCETLRTPYEAITKFNLWLTNVTTGSADWEIWANSPSFDCDILAHHLRHYGNGVPWKFWQERDVRTIKSLSKALKLSVRLPDNPHNALKDAFNQRLLVEAVFDNLADHVHKSREASYTGASSTFFSKDEASA